MGGAAIERAEWSKKVRAMAEALYDHGAPAYWVKWGLSLDPMHREFIEKFLGRLSVPSDILDAACGAGRFDGILSEAGHRVLGIDQSSGVLAKAQEHFPQEHFPTLNYVKIGLQEMDFQTAFDGIICMDAMEHICPEDYPGILHGFQEALKPGGVLYLTADRAEEPDFDLEAYYERAKAAGLPVVFGEVADDAAFERALEHPEVSGEQADIAVYHYYPPLEKVREWINQAGLAIEEEGMGSGWCHFLTRNKKA